MQSSIELKQLFYQKMATNTFGRMDWGAGHLTVIVGMGGGAFAIESYPQDRAFDQIFASVRGLPGRILAAGIDSHINCMNSAGGGSA